MKEIGIQRLERKLKMSRVGEKIKEARLKAGMTQKAQSWSILSPLTVRQIQVRTKLYTPVMTIPEERNL